MNIQCRNFLSPEETEFVLRLWNTEYPARLVHASIAGLEIYLSTLQETVHHLVLNDTGNPVAWAAVFNRDGGRWFAMIIDNSVQRMGIGRELLDEMKRKEFQLNAWAIDHATDFKVDRRPYLSPLPFYLKNGFETCPDQRFESDKMSAIKIIWKTTSPNPQL